MSSENNQASEHDGRGLGTWGKLAIAVFLLPTGVVLFPTAIVLVVLMLPTLVAFVIDRQVGRPFTITVGLLNASGSLPGILELWSQGHTMASAQVVLTSVVFWFGAYLAAAVGWTLYTSLPPLMRRYYGSITDSRVKALQKDQEKLIEEWGEEVAGVSKSVGKSKPDAHAQIDAAAEDLPG